MVSRLITSVATKLKISYGFVTLFLSAVMTFKHYAWKLTKSKVARAPWFVSNKALLSNPTINIIWTNQPKFIYWSIFNLKTQFSLKQLSVITINISWQLEQTPKLDWDLTDWRKNIKILITRYKCKKLCYFTKKK